MGQRRIYVPSSKSVSAVQKVPVKAAINMTSIPTCKPIFIYTTFLSNCEDSQTKIYKMPLQKQKQNKKIILSKQCNTHRLNIEEEESEDGLPE